MKSPREKQSYRLASMSEVVPHPAGMGISRDPLEFWQASNLVAATAKNTARDCREPTADELAEINSAPSPREAMIAFLERNNP